MDHQDQQDFQADKVIEDRPVFKGCPDLEEPPDLKVHQGIVNIAAKSGQCFSYRAQLKARAEDDNLKKPNINIMKKMLCKINNLFYFVTPGANYVVDSSRRQSFNLFCFFLIIS